jgi:hypothetical protein
VKIIFLDVDGVLNWAGTKERYRGYIGIDPTRVDRFNQIIDAYSDAKIVVSSTWRKGVHGAYEAGRDGIAAVLAKHGVRGEVIDITPIHSHGWKTRGGEIREWLEDHADEVTTYVILDDDTDGMAPREEYGDHLDLRPHHVVTDWIGDPNVPGEEGGLQDRHVREAIAILGGVVKQEAA